MPDVVDEADLVTAQMVAVRIMALRQQLLAPEHGRKDCEVCSQPIGDARLKVMPGATQCVHCQASEEQRNKHYLR